MGARAGEERLAFLAEANRALNASLDPEQTLDHLTRLAVPRMADWCAVNIRREQGAFLKQHVAHADPKMVSIVQELTERYPPDPLDPNSPVNQVLASGRPMLLRRIPESLIEAGAHDEEHLRMIRALKLRSAILVPLLGRRRPIGVLTLVYAESGRRYGQSDMTFAEEMAAMAAMALDNAQLHQERSRIADTLQSSLLPPEIPEIPGVELAARYRPAGEGNLVGGDFYDVFEAGEGTWAVALGDVCGKGPEAAALTGLVRHSLRTAAVREPRPSRVLSSVNRQILRHEDDRFCTVTLARLRRSNGKFELTVSSGGHPLPLVYRPTRTVETIDCAGTLLGVFKTPDLTDHPVTLEPGDAAVFYTDGVTERFERAGGGGEAALVSLLWSCNGLDAAGIADRIYRDAGVLDPDEARDDMAMVVLRVSPPAA